ncbi:hypothetical protein MRB53_039885 [Persea americana]|nr:hypothetical protein MRB53_039885 [Persea americana]
MDIGHLRVINSMLRRQSNVANLCDKVVQLLLGRGVLGSHLLVLLLPHVSVLYCGLRFALVVSRLHICCSQSANGRQHRPLVEY